MQSPLLLVRKDKLFRYITAVFLIVTFYLFSEKFSPVVSWVLKADQEIGKAKLQTLNRDKIQPVNILKPTSDQKMIKLQQHKMTQKHKIDKIKQHLFSIPSNSNPNSPKNERIKEKTLPKQDQKIDKNVQEKITFISKTVKNEENVDLKSDQNMNKDELTKLNSIRESCGELCNTSRAGTPGPYFNHVIAPIDCGAIYKNPFIDEGHNLKAAPRKIPKELWSEFTMNNRLPVTAWYFDRKYVGHAAEMPVWTKELVVNNIKLAAQGTLQGTYGASETNALREGMTHAPGIKNGRVLVIGSENPWVESVVLEQGAKEVVTLEYGKIKSEHPQIKTMIPSEFKESFLNGTLGLFDAVVTFSSVEHSGLGRYGDRLNPWGDIIAIARAWCVTKEKGSLTIGVMYDNEKDYLKFNAGRWYGKLRYPYLCTNWKQHYRGNGLQRVHVFIK